MFQPELLRSECDNSKVRRSCIGHLNSSAASGKSAPMYPKSVAALRQIDHLVLPTADLATARHRLASLGFTVAPDGRHPFGTVNCCVYFGGGTFIEPLAVGDPVIAQASANAGNVFVLRDAMFREAWGDEGLSALVAASADAGSDQLRYVDAGVSAGDILEFTRPFVGADGASDNATFRLAVAAVPSLVSPFLFSCQRVGVPAVDRSALESHRNGVRRLARVILFSEPDDVLVRLVETVFGACTGRTDRAASFATPNGEVVVLRSGPEIRAFQSLAGGADDCAAIEFEVESKALLLDVLTANAVVWAEHGRSIAVPRAPGQGAAFLFTEKS